MAKDRRFYDYGYSKGKQVFSFLPELEDQTEGVQDCVDSITGVIGGVIEELYELVDSDLADLIIHNIQVQVERAKLEGHFDDPKFIQNLKDKKQ